MTLKKSEFWGYRKEQALWVSKLLYDHDYLKHSYYMKRCGDYLRFNVVELPRDGFDLVTDSDYDRFFQEFRLISANFCRNRICPICSWRLARRWRSQMRLALPKVQRKFNCRFLFLTLTIKNCHIDNLSDTLKHLSASFKRLRDNYLYSERLASIKGWLRFTEITRNFEDNTAHPHYHCLLIVDRDYFSKNSNKYITQDRFIEIWKDCLKADYFPSVDIRAIKDDEENLGKAIVETAKYCVKGGDLIDDNGEWLVKFWEQSRNFQFRGRSQNLNSFFNIKNIESDLIGSSDNKGFSIGYVTANFNLDNGYSFEGEYRNKGALDDDYYEDILNDEVFIKTMLDYESNDRKGYLNILRKNTIFNHANSY